jgi:hypothetical protein
MADSIAVLGLRVDSSQVTTAAAQLDKFTGAGKNAANSAAALTAGTGLARHEMINLSRQIQDVGVSLVSGQSPFLILAQQGTQIADIFGSSKTGSVGGALKQIGSSVASFITPMRAFGVVAAGVGVAAYAMNSAWNTFTLKLDDTARASNLTTRELSKLQAVASFKGIDGGEFSKGIENFAKGVYDAKNNMGELAQVFRANRIVVGDTSASLEKAADLIKNAKNDQQRLVLLQQMGLPATMEWVRMLSGGAEGLRKAKAAAADFAADDNMILRARQFDEAWNRAWTNFGLNARSAFQRALDGGATFFDKMERLANRAGNASIWTSILPSNHAEIAAAQGVKPLSPFEQRFGGDSANPAKSNFALQDGLRADADRRRNQSTIDKNALQKDIADQQTLIGLYGQTASAEQAASQVQLAAYQIYLSTGVAVSRSKIEQLKQLAREQNLGVTAIKASTDAQNVEAATVGMGVGQVAEYAARLNAINEARRAGRTLTPANVQAIRDEAAALGQAAQNADLMKSAYTGLVQGPMQTFVSSISQGASAMDALKKSGASALNSIATKLTDMAASNLWSSAFGGSGGLMSLLGIGGGTVGNGGIVLGGASGPGMFAGVNHTGHGPGDSMSGRYVHPAHFDDAPRFHSGIGPGERPAIIRNDESVLTPGQMRQLSPNGGGASNVTVTIDMAADGTWKAHVKDVAQTTTAQGISSFVQGPSFAQHVGNASVQANQMRLDRR